MPELFKLHAQFQNELLLIESQQIGYELSPDLFQELREALQVNICDGFIWDFLVVLQPYQMDLYPLSPPAASWTSSAAWDNYHKETI